jgi:uncharacterized protein YecT (DUF1311 family)
MKKNILMLIFLTIVLLTGCGNNASNEASQNVELDDYILSIKEQSDIIKKALEQDTLTQTDMNIKSRELYELWDDALNYLWSELKSSLSEEEFAKLKEEQRIWIVKKEKTVEEVGKEFIGGTIYSLVVNTEAAKLTEERVYELYKLFKEL